MDKVTEKINTDQWLAKHYRMVRDDLGRRCERHRFRQMARKHGPCTKSQGPLLFPTHIPTHTLNGTKERYGGRLSAALVSAHLRSPPRPYANCLPRALRRGA